VRRFSFPGSSPFASRSPLSGAGAHLFLREGHGLKLPAFLRPIQNTAAQEGQFLYLDAIPSYQREIGPDRAFRSYAVLSRAFKCEDAKSHILGESDQSELHLSAPFHFLSAPSGAFSRPALTSSPICLWHWHFVHTVGFEPQTFDELLTEGQLDRIQFMARYPRIDELPAE